MERNSKSHPGSKHLSLLLGGEPRGAVNAASCRPLQTLTCCYEGREGWHSRKVLEKCAGMGHLRQSCFTACEPIRSRGNSEIQSRLKLLLVTTDHIQQGWGLSACLGNLGTVAIWVQRSCFLFCSVSCGDCLWNLHVQQDMWPSVLHLVPLG